MYGDANTVRKGGRKTEDKTNILTSATLAQSGHGALLEMLGNLFGI
jgi:hypothetical protein